MSPTSYRQTLAGLLSRHRWQWLACGGSVTWLLLSACGARSGLDLPAVVEADGGSSGSTPRCSGAEDCDPSDRCEVMNCVDGECVGSRRLCDDGDECTEDDCDPATGACLFTPRANDLDGDGFPGPLPGFEPGAPGACGNDCDDTAAAAHPGGTEICDGLDNDCNGIVDDGAMYVADDFDPIRLSPDGVGQANPGGIAYNGDLYAITYHGQTENWRSYFHGLDASGRTIVPPRTIASASSDAFSGPIRWNGSVFATVWEDRRDNDYEIYFNRVDQDGDPLGPDVRVSYGEDFSLHPDLVWNGRQYVVVWDDLRDEQSAVYGRLLDAEGRLITNEIVLVDSSLSAEAPNLAQGTSRMGMVFKWGPATDQRIGFMALGMGLEPSGQIIEPATGRAVSPTITAAGGRFLVAWHTREGLGPGNAIWGAVLDETGRVLVPERPITSGALFARSKAWLPLGDRVLLVWAADVGSGYDLFAKLLDLDLRDLTPVQRVASTPTDSVSPILAFGPRGDIGVLFRDQSDGWQTFFTRLRCRAGG